ncbi:hypothetical protein GCM10027422_20440 [Hymenobacter arcticus]
MRKFLLLAGALAFSTGAALAQTYSVRAYGAVADGRTVATAAI